MHLIAYKGGLQVGGIAIQAEWSDDESDRDVGFATKATSKENSTGRTDLTAIHEKHKGQLEVDAGIIRSKPQHNIYPYQSLHGSHCVTAILML